MLIIFTVNDQRVTHDLKQTLVSDSVVVVKAAFTFDSSWDDLHKVIVFTNSRCQKPCPVKCEGEAFDIPVQVLHPGKLCVSVVGFGDGKRKTTQAWDIQQAITVQKCGAMGGCDLLRGMVEEKKASEYDVASDAEVKDMLEEVFGKQSGDSSAKQSI